MRQQSVLLTVVDSSAGRAACEPPIAALAHKMSDLFWNSSKPTKVPAKCAGPHGQMEYNMHDKVKK